MTDVDQLLRAHADASAREPATDGWDLLVERLQEQPPIVVPLGRPRRDRRPIRRLVLPAAAALVVVAVTAIAVGDDDRERIDPTETTAAPAADPRPPDPRDGTASTVSSPPTTVSVSPFDPLVPPDPAPMPSELVAIVDDGDDLGAVVLFRGLGQVPAAAPDRTELVAAPVMPSDAVHAASGPVGIDRSPDGSIVYGTCCEPAVGAVWILDAGGGEPRLLGHGEHPAVSPDGTTVAVFVAGVGISTIDVATGRTRPVLVGGQAVSSGPNDLATGLAWSRDGTRLLVDWLIHDEETGGTDRMVELLDPASGERTSIRGGAAAGGSAHGTFLADGTVAFVTGVPEARDEPVVGTGISVFDPATGAFEPRYADLRITGLDTTSDGGWVIATSEEGTARVLAGDDLRDEGTLVADQGLRAAAW